ncbi:MAG TPA: hypothetical protein VJO34_17610 [Methylomirabilota bacterium]|nr:hypothetical protein [Methylomirabilota bacterium]
MAAWIDLAIGLFIVVALAGLCVVAWRALQLCPHCGWIVRRVTVRWLRCPRCHRQYGQSARRR